MALSSIAPITLEGQPQELTSFLRAGVMYVVWQSAINDVGLRRLHWKPHTGLDFTEVIPALAADFHNVTAVLSPGTDQLIVVWDDGAAQLGVADGHIYSARFNVLTGALLSGPTALFFGSKPRISYRVSAGEHFVLYYLTAKSGGIYGRLSTDGGVTWQSGMPLLTNQVLSTTKVEVVPYDSEHVSIAQLGGDPRGLAEIGMLQRTRPLSSIIKHPSMADRYFIGEPSRFDDVFLTDNQRGSLVLSTDNTLLYHLDGVPAGTADGIGAVALLVATGTALAVTASAGPTGNSDDLNRYDLTPAATAFNIDLPGASACAVALAVSSTHAYIAMYADNSSVVGQFVVVDLSSGATGTVFSGVTGVRAVSVANFLSPPLIFVASTESGAEHLRVYEQNALTPTLLLDTKIPARANSVTVSTHPTNPTSVRVLISMVDRFNIYDYTSPSVPVVLVDSHRFSGGGQFFKAQVAANGTIVAAAGNAGVLALSPSGKVRAQIRVSGKIVPEWVPTTAYSTNQLVKPRTRHQFARNRFYFRCSSGGTSGSGEPAWATTGTILDSGAQWVPVAVVDAIVTDVALDETTKRIYAVGSVGGALGTDGRVWLLSANGLI